MLTVALTGGIGAGKSSVARILEECGARILYLDDVARSVMEPGGQAFGQVAARWPNAIDDGRVDRAALAAIVFSDPAELRTLDAIVHPHAWEAAHRRLEAWQAEDGDGVAVVELALLVGSAHEYAFHGTVVVSAPIRVRVERLVRDRAMAHEDAHARIASQSDPLHLADLVIDNGGDAAALEEAARRAWDGWFAPFARNLARGLRVEGSGRPPTSAERARALARLRHRGIDVRERDGEPVVSGRPSLPRMAKAGFVPAEAGGFVSANPAFALGVLASRGDVGAVR